jgi:hypothetical protein
LKYAVNEAVHEAELVRVGQSINSERFNILILNLLFGLTSVEGGKTKKRGRQGSYRVLSNTPI